jgi:hypothetical protein
MIYSLKSENLSSDASSNRRFQGIQARFKQDSSKLNYFGMSTAIGPSASSIWDARENMGFSDVTCYAQRTKK